MSFKMDLTYEVSWNKLIVPTEIQANSIRHKINELENSVIWEIMKIWFNFENWLFIDTDMKTSQIWSELVFLFFTYKWKLFLSLLHNINPWVYALHILTKIWEELDNILWEYNWNYTFLDIRKFSDQWAINTKTLDMILEWKELPWVELSKCIIRV